MFYFFKKEIFTLTVLGLMVGTSATASADEVRIAGSTLGRFNANAFASSDSLLDLSYSNSTFDNTTVGGLLDFGGNPTPGTNFNNLGSFTLGSTDQDYNGNTFELFVNFSAPTTIVGGSTTIFSDRLIGSVVNGVGGVFIDFDNTVQSFSFTNADWTGTFTMFVNDVSLAPGQSASLTGHLTGSMQPVPEPTAMVALVVGGLGLLRRRKISRA